MLNISFLKNSGYDVFIKHKRRYSGIEELLSKRQAIEIRSIPFIHPGRLLSRGGTTEVSIYYKDKYIAGGTAVCSDKDNFARKMGVRIAFGRALKDASIVREKSSLHTNKILERIGFTKLV